MTIGPQRQHTSEEVAGMTSEEFSEARSAAARVQRGVPESVMTGIQYRIGGGVYSGALEHVGDLTHRINEFGGRLGLQEVRPKVVRMHNLLHQGYGFEREMGENIRDNLRLRAAVGGQGATAEEIRALGTQYAEAHRQVPVLNEPSYHARSAAISLGEHEFNRTRSSLDILERHTRDITTWNELTNQRMSVQFLRHLEERGILPG